jgi:hypothetical protein
MLLRKGSESYEKVKFYKNKKKQIKTLILKGKGK